MNYQQALDYLFTQLPMFSKLGSKAYKADLSNTILLCNKLHNPQLQFPTVHIAGTNGKGSVSHTLAAILQTAGYKTGLYTSPHLKDFRERIKINGVMCSKDFVVQFTNTMKNFIEQHHPSFFEITVAMAFEYFAQEKVDIAIIETGLGGRLDSTNIITPQLSVITNISLDHIQILGETLELIASEKAGIIKQNTPVVIGETLPETKNVFEQKANTVNAPIVFAEQENKVINFFYNHELLAIEIENNFNKQRTKYNLDLTGIYQTKNIITVLSAVHQLQKIGWKINEEHLHQALQNVKKITGLQGRWQLLKTSPTVIADVAHNEAGIKQVLHQLKNISYKHLHIVIGMVKDKDVNKVLGLLPQQATYYFTQAQIPRALPVEELQKLANTKNLMGNNFENVNRAIDAATNSAQKNDLILAIGSVFLIGEIEIL
ncbi:MAG: bifunctional folylpolyglutamate synthase/dihydrofolate synthase [Chitinophagaceae bacterium]|nr:bifunctional folylpolyglutamate synthase/dihydrofolate synthase [Chitinophagaceae bacterium]